MSATKAELRTAALAKRDALSDEARAAAAQALAKRGLPFAIEPGMVVSGYSPIRSEIDPVPLMRNLAEKGAKLALPAVLARGQSLAFRAWSPDDRLVMGLAHKSLPVHGVQFHPESIASEHGHLMLKNFLDLAAQWNAAHGRTKLH